MRKDVPERININDLRSFNEMILAHRRKPFTVRSIRKEPSVNITLDDSEIIYAISELVNRRLIVRIGDKYYIKPLTKCRTLKK
jgi:hypothetical protein